MSIDAEFRTANSSFSLEIALHCAPGEVVALLGPNGSGKSTTLRTIAGLNAISDGRISIGGTVVDDGTCFVAPQERRIGYVFQDYVLFPHLSVRENIAFGANATGVEAWIDRMQLTDVADRKPAQLSGGQAQRCALARALATDPQALLLDEPLAALDAGTRITVRTELRSHLRSFEHGTVLVTHDPLDAMVLADRIIVLENGRVTQHGAAADVAAHPQTEYVATLMGMTLVRGVAKDGVLTCTSGGALVSSNTTVNGDAIALVRPEAVSLHRHRPEGSPRNVLLSVVTDLSIHVDRVRVSLAGPPELTATVTPAAVSELQLTVGSEVWVSVKATDVALYSG